MNKKYSEIEVGKVYWYDVAGMLKSLRKETKTVRVLSLKNRKYDWPLAECVSIETGEKFCCDIGHLQFNPEVMKRKFVTLRKYYRKHNPKMIIKWSSIVRETHEQLVIIGFKLKTNHVLAVDSNGRVRTFDICHTQLNIERDKAYDDYQKSLFWEEDDY